MPVIPRVNLVCREGRGLRPDLGHGRCWDKSNTGLVSHAPLGSQGDGELNRTQYVFLDLLCPVKNILSFCGLLPPCLVFMPCIHLPWTFVEGCRYEPPHMFPGSQVISHLLEPQCHHFFYYFCVCLLQESESYTRVGPQFSGFCFFQCSAQNWPQRRYLKNYFFIRN